MIKIVCVGTIKERFFKEACDEYKKRLKRWVKIEEIEVKEEDENRFGSIDLLLEKEGEKILRYLKDGQYTIVCDSKGVQMTSKEFTQVLKSKMDSGKDIIFIIGGSNGLSSKIKQKADMIISFSALTFPHQLFRVILFEQVYRAFTIIENIKYHK